MRLIGSFKSSFSVRPEWVSVNGCRLDDPLLWGILPPSVLVKPQHNRWALGASDILFTNRFFILANTPSDHQTILADLLTGPDVAHQQIPPLPPTRDKPTLNNPRNPPPQRPLQRLDPHLPRSKNIPSPQPPHALLQNGHKQTHPRSRSHPPRRPHVPFRDGKGHGGGESADAIPALDGTGHSRQVWGADGFGPPAAVSGAVGQGTDASYQGGGAGAAD
jgi:hypothetical protein